MSCNKVVRDEAPTGNIVANPLFKLPEGNALAHSFSIREVGSHNI
jgi:hypothetical protein